MRPKWGRQSNISMPQCLTNVRIMDPARNLDADLLDFHIFLVRQTDFPFI
jgi:hypothetical protein